jgi:hypothetical protein
MGNPFALQAYNYLPIKLALWACLLVTGLLAGNAVQAQSYQYIAISKPGKTIYLRQGDAIYYRLHDDTEKYEGIFERYLGNALLISGAVILQEEIRQISLLREERLNRLARGLGSKALLAGPAFFAMDAVNPIFRGDNMHVSRQNIRISSMIAGTGLALLALPSKKHYRINKTWQLELVESDRILPRKSRIKLIL